MKNYKDQIVNYLIIVEGKRLEVSIFTRLFEEILPNFKVFTHIEDSKGTINTLIIDETIKKKIFIVKPKHNTLSSIMKDVDENDGNIFAYQKLFKKSVPSDYFRKIFYIFDVDYTSNFNIKKALDFFCDENDQGLLLLSSPYIEGICDFNALDYTFIKEPKKKISNVYKPYVRNKIIKISNTSKQKNGLSIFIEQNIFTLMLHSLHKNHKIYNELDFVRCVDCFSIRSLPRIKGDTYFFPVVTSFIHVAVGLIFELNLKSNPTFELDCFLKRFCSSEPDKATIYNASRFLKKGH